MRKSKNKKLAKAKAIKYFNLYIRRSNSDSNGLSQCVTCGTFKLWTELEAGHFISCRFEATRFDERNCNPQCKKCNRFEYGNQFEHGVKIDQIHGEGTAEKIWIKSKMKCFRKQDDYEIIAETYKQKLNEL